jgi:hypothetical protein
MSTAIDFVSQSRGSGGPALLAQFDAAALFQCGTATRIYAWQMVDSWTIPQWNSVTTYQTGQQVAFLGAHWTANTQNLNCKPAPGTSYWTLSAVQPQAVAGINSDATASCVVLPYTFAAGDSMAVRCSDGNYGGATSATNIPVQHGVAINLTGPYALLLPAGSLNNPSATGQRQTPFITGTCG